MLPSIIFLTLNTMFLQNKYYYVFVKTHILSRETNYNEY